MYTVSSGTLNPTQLNSQVRHCLRQTQRSSVLIWTVQNPRQAVAECWDFVPDSCSSNFCHPTEYWSSGSANVGIGRAKITAPRVVGDELAFLRQVQRGMCPLNKQIGYQPNVQKDESGIPHVGGVLPPFYRPCRKDLLQEQHIFKESSRACWVCVGVWMTRQLCLCRNDISELLSCDRRWYLVTYWVTTSACWTRRVPLPSTMRSPDTVRTTCLPWRSLLADDTGLHCATSIVLLP